MPDDETMVRQRLLWLLGSRGAALSRTAPDPAVVPDPATVADPVPASAADPDSDPDSDPVADRRHPIEPPQPDRPARLPGPGAFDPGRRGVKALAVLAAVVVIVAAGWAWRSRPRSEPVTASPAPAAAPDQPAADGVAAQDGGQAPAAGPGTSPGVAEVVVAVAGRVRRPGLVRLPAGARVADALEAAGGPLAGTDVTLLNLARKVTDGELILVGVTAPPGAAPGGPAGNPAPGANGAAGAAGAGGKVSLNTATLAELDGLPGVGPVLAQRIIDHREQRGGFRAISDLRQVTGIGDARYEDLKNLVTL